MTTRTQNPTGRSRIANAQEDPVSLLLERGPALPRFDASRLQAHLPSPRRIRIEINGCLCGAPFAIPDAPAELAAGWAFAHRFFELPEHLGRISATDSHISMMVQGGVDLERAKLVAAGWQPDRDVELELSREGSERTPRAVAVMTGMEAIRVCQRVFRKFRDDGARVGYIHAGIAGRDDALCIARDLHVHGAVHKAIGWSLTSRTECDEEILVVRGIVDQHIVETAARLGIPIVATDVVPTDDAIDAAVQTCTTVIGLVTSPGRGLFADGGHLDDDKLPFTGGNIECGELDA